MLWSGPGSEPPLRWPSDWEVPLTLKSLCFLSFVSESAAAHLLGAYGVQTKVDG